jgi:hypothetical protein
MSRTETIPLRPGSGKIASLLERRGVTLSAEEQAQVFTDPIRSLLTAPEGNPKIAKGLRRGVATAILHLSPAQSSGLQVCPKATAGCRSACLNTAGRGGMGLDADGLNTIQRARRRRTLQFFARREEFLERLVRELETHIRRARSQGLVPAVRLNGTSDLVWERIPVVRAGKRYPNIMRAFPRVQFYDYTKRTDRGEDGAGTPLPANYHLTFSLADGNDDDAEAAFAQGLNVAVVLRSAEIARRAGTRYARLAPLPSAYQGRALVDGDESDLRFRDPSGSWVGLRAKGRAVTEQSGFVRDLAHSS